jgi:hypothetical protein
VKVRRGRRRKQLLDDLKKYDTRNLKRKQHLPFRGEVCLEDSMDLVRQTTV